MIGDSSRDIRFGEFHARKNEDSANQRSRNGTDGIKGLGKIQAAFGTLRITELRNERIRGGFEERKPAGHHEQRTQEKFVTSGERRRPEEERSGREQQQPSDKSRFVARALHQKRRRNGQYEVAHIKGALHKSGLKPRNLKGLHELADEHVVEIVGNAPEKKQEGNQEERRELAGRKKCVRGRGRFGGDGHCRRLKRHSSPIVAGARQRRAKLAANILWWRHRRKSVLVHWRRAG